MALYLGEKWPPVMERTPPAFQHEENKIWTAFVDAFGDHYQGFYYNVKLGEDLITPEQRMIPEKRMTEEIGLKRIDAIGIRTDCYDIFEVRRRAGPGTFGQLIAYEQLWTRFGLPDRSYTLNIVTDFMDLDTQIAAKAHGLTVFIV